MESIKEKILEEYKKGNIVVADFECLKSMNLIEFLKQPLAGILYDLNRDEATVLSFTEDPKWINDFAVSKTISALKNQLKIAEKALNMVKDWDDELEEKYEEPGYLAKEYIDKINSVGF